MRDRMSYPGSGYPDKAKHQGTRPSAEDLQGKIDWLKSKPPRKKIELLRDFEAMKRGENVPGASEQYAGWAEEDFEQLIQAVGDPYDDMDSGPHNYMD